MSSEVATKDDIVMHNTDTTMLNSENTLNDEHIEESKDHVHESLENDAPSSGRADLTYGNELHQAANQLQHCKYLPSIKQHLIRI